MECIVWKGISEDDADELKERVKHIVKIYLHFKDKVIFEYSKHIE